MRVLLFGTFDHFHPGHVFLLREAQERGEVTVVVARDVNVERIKGRLPRQNEGERRAAAEKACPGVTVILGDLEDFLAPIRSICPDLIILGYDQKLPPGVSEADLQVPVERLPGHEPHRWKSSIRQVE